MKPAQVLVVAALGTMLCTGNALPAEPAGEGMPGGKMQEMMKTPRHRMVMAYKRNLVNFARTLRSEAASSGKIDRDLASRSVNEMKRSLEEMRKLHEEHRAAMSEEMKKTMNDKITAMDRRLSTLKLHLDTLESEVKRDAPDAQKIQAQLDQILTEAEMGKKGMKQKKGTRK